MTTSPNRPSYSGWVIATDEDIARIYDGSVQPMINQYVVHHDDVYRWDGAALQKVRYTKLDKFAPKNDEQRMAFDLLDNDDIPIKALVGIAGSGKTKAALMYGFNKLKASRQLQKMVVVKQPAPVGEEIGHLKGDKADKMRPWMGSIYDNVDGGEQTIFWMTQKGQIEFDVPAYMQGRSIPNAFIVVDEAQLLTYEQVKMLGSRADEGSVVVFCGDYEQIFNRKYKVDNGLISLVDKFAGLPEFGVVTLNKSVRSRVAELFATRM